MSYENLYGLLPNYAGLANLAAAAQEINAAAASGQITVEEQMALLEDLVRSHAIISEAQAHEQKLFANQVISVLASLPLP